MAKSTRLTEFLAKLERLHGLEHELTDLDERRDGLRQTIAYVRQEIDSARTDLEARLDGAQLPRPPVPPMPDPPRGPSGPGYSPERARKKPRRIDPWKPGQPIVPSVAALLRLFPPDGILSFRELQQLCPEMSHTILRGRVGKARQYKLLEPAGWGKYRLAEHAKSAVFGGGTSGLRIVED